MVLYRRNRIPGGTYFFTATLADRRSSALTDNIDPLRVAVHEVRLAHSFSLLAWVVLPDRVHMIWRRPDGDIRYSLRWRLIKARFTSALLRRGLVSPIRGDGGRRVWARRFWEHTIRSEEALARHVDYIHFNPMKHGWVERVRDWRHSSFHRYVERGQLSIDWGDSCVVSTLVAGE